MSHKIENVALGAVLLTFLIATLYNKYKGVTSVTLKYMGWVIDKKEGSRMMNFEHDMKEFEKVFPKQKKIINGVTFTFRIAGNGDKTLVLLVGGLGMSDGLYNHAMAFVKDYRVLLFDYPYGYKTNTELVDGIAKLMIELELGKVVLIGQSYGGFVAQMIASRYKKHVSELIISNTGCLSVNLNETDMIPMYAMMKKMKKVKMVTRLIPMSLLRGTLVKKSMKHLKGCTDKEQEYMQELFILLFRRLTNRRERHMCSLMIDLLNSKRSSKEDFRYLDGRVLLILSKDDETFSEKIKHHLIELMPNPIVCNNLSGGHLAMILKIDLYITLVKDFLGNSKA